MLSSFLIAKGREGMRCSKIRFTANGGKGEKESESKHRPDSSVGLWKCRHVQPAGRTKEYHPLPRLPHAICTGVRLAFYLPR